IIRRGKETGFTFTQFLSRAELACEDLSAIPVIVQESLDPKLDVRVFVVGKRMTSIAITDEIGHPISGDWRIHPSQVKCAIYNTPRDVLEKCQLLVQALGLNFAAIDLAVHHGEHFFLEVNPTGEWGWVMDIPG